MPPTSYEIFNLHPDVMSGIRAAGYEAPTSLQLQAIPLIMQGKDIIGIAETGTDKTAAFILPSLHRLLPGQRGYTRALIISPTPELSEQTGKVLKQLVSTTDLHFTALSGDMSTAPQAKELRSGPEIIIGCPNHILKYLWKGKINLSNIEILVIDEADRMSGLGLLPDVFNILMCITTKRQTLLFSATLPDNLRRLARQFLHDPVMVKDEPQFPVKTDPRLQKTKTSTQKAVDPVIKPVPHDLKTALLRGILGKTKINAVLVYARTKTSAERTAQQVIKAGYRVTALQGNLTRRLKPVALEGFSGGRVFILVVTDAALRGIDVSVIFRLINYEKTGNAGDDIHRLGRTGKIDGNGDAFTLVTSTDPVNIHALEQLLETPLVSLALQGG
jgi:ATP-dependent RNA helicase RhlE